uniref:Uncharacterized protein n=1 Tax=Panagrolaimus davidi TaxID=227884 RepID=A0A914QEQ3_9BILA
MNCTFPSKKLVIFASHDFISTPTAIQITNNYGNCVFDRTIFNMETYNGSVSAISGNQHQCSITLIMGAYAYYYISEIWTTANNEKVSVFIGTNELYFEFK